jgi:hypothetical protein
MSTRAFAEHLGVALRTVAKWESLGAETQPRPDTQAILDTAHAQVITRRSHHVAEKTSVSLRQLEVAGQRAGVTGVRGTRADGGWKPTEKIIGQRLTSRFVRTSRSRVARAGSVRYLVRIRQFPGTRTRH